MNYIIFGGSKHNVSVFISKVDLSNGTFYLNRSYTLPIKYMTEYLGISHNCG